MHHSNRILTPFSYYYCCIVLSSLWTAVFVDAMDSTAGANTNHLLSFLNENNNNEDENDDSNASHSSTIVGMCLVATYVIVILFGFVTMRKELGQVRVS